MQLAAPVDVSVLRGKAATPMPAVPTVMASAPLPASPGASPDAVIMAVYGTLRLPPQARHMSENRLRDIVRIAQAEHHRLASYIAYDLHTSHPLAASAADLPVPLIFVERDSPTTWIRTLNHDLNTNFDVHDPSMPLWRLSVTAPREWRGNGVAIDPDELARDKMRRTGLPFTARDMPVFDMAFTFHHCIGDGLSMWAFARTFFKYFTAAALNAPSLQLDRPVNAEPPPLLDNLINANALEIIPPLVGVVAQYLSKGSKGQMRRIVASRTVDDGDAASPMSQVSPATPLMPPTAASTTAPSGYGAVSSDPGDRDSDTTAPGGGAVGLRVATSQDHLPQMASTAALTPAQAASLPSASEIPATTPPATPMATLSPQPHTSTRLTLFDMEFVADLRAAAKRNKTTIAGVLIVSALVAVRVTFTPHAKRLGVPVPRKQGWVVTTSMRHLIPGSRLLDGADKQTDPSTQIFGGYGGSIADPALRVDDKSDFWDRCRRVRRRIGAGLFTSMRRNKLMNWCYRHPAVWQFLHKRTDIRSQTRLFSVEMANLGAWDYAAAAPDAPDDDERVRMDRFGGTLNCSFDGARAMFSIGVITLGSDMSVTVGYDQAAVADAEADEFIRRFNAILVRLRSAQGKIRVRDLAGVI
ncbi:hypothetical protein HK105_208790 [Polyrhizophydium stewartii]|uniref:Condensation domain-containing protein n=1 Tax=Polyrhizophydium stewartii TaxID=2732419 RepID=A0ABR4MWW5_9FUNG